MQINKNKYHANPIKKQYFLLVLLLSQLNSCAFYPWEKGVDKNKSPESQVSDAKNKIEKDPEGTLARKNLIITNELAVTKLFTEAELAISKGKYDVANALYDRVLEILPENPNAIDGKNKVAREQAQSNKLDKATELIEASKLDEAKALIHDVLIENPLHQKALKLQQQIAEKSTPSNAKPPQLKAELDKPVTLELRDVNIKVAFEALSRATGINFILDKDIKPDTKASIFVKKARIEDAIEMVLSSNGLQKKVLAENTVLVFPSNPQKLKDYQDLMIRSFYLTNTTAKQVAALVKTMLKTKDVFVDDRLNMMTMRDTPEVIRIAEKLVAANDLADPEVMLDIQVFEVSRSRLQELGIEYPNRIAVNSLTTSEVATAAGSTVVTTTSTAASQLTLEGLLNLNKSRFDVSPNPAVNFRKTTGDVNVLSNPRIRVRNNEKAKILVGDKVPVITTTSTANVGISESVQYVDVGLTVNVEPRITPDNYVNIKIGLEVSSLGDKTTTKNGATVYTIGTRNANTTLRLKDGETQVLAGLISDDERKSASKLPGLGDIPLIGRLFSNQSDQKNKTEIVLAITPRIVTNITRPNAEISEYWSGTDAVISDKPMLNIPASSNAPLSPEDALRERLRMRREIRNATQQIAPDQPAVEQPQPAEAPAQTETPPTAQPETPAPSASPDGTELVPN